jgi:hypothetical protein
MYAEQGSRASMASAAVKHAEVELAQQAKFVHQGIVWKYALQQNMLQQMPDVIM